MTTGAGALGFGVGRTDGTSMAALAFAKFYLSNMRSAHFYTDALQISASKVRLRTQQSRGSISLC